MQFRTSLIKLTHFQILDSDIVEINVYLLKNRISYEGCSNNSERI